ncbi:MAG: hypothetical protein KJZ78_19745 [Bryobacteraceae bacterium]|nr:hypothetical protein [Bryobacteraceae bacterium]
MRLRQTSSLISVLAALLAGTIAGLPAPAKAEKSPVCPRLNEGIRGPAKNTA